MYKHRNVGRKELYELLFFLTPLPFLLPVVFISTRREDPSTVKYIKGIEDATFAIFFVLFVLYWSLPFCLPSRLPSSSIAYTQSLSSKMETC